MHPGTLDASPGVLAQFLEWVAARPRTYQETMTAWRTSCPRLSVWEDALLGGLVTLESGPAAGQGQAQVVLTPAGLGKVRRPA